MQNNDILECLLVLMETMHLEFEVARRLAQIIQEPTCQEASKFKYNLYLLFRNMF